MIGAATNLQFPPSPRWLAGPAGLPHGPAQSRERWVGIGCRWARLHTGRHSGAPASAILPPGKDALRCRPRLASDSDRTGGGATSLGGPGGFGPGSLTVVTTRSWDGNASIAVGDLHLKIPKWESRDPNLLAKFRGQIQLQSVRVWLVGPADGSDYRTPSVCDAKEWVDASTDQFSEEHLGSPSASESKMNQG